VGGIALNSPVDVTVVNLIITALTVTILIGMMRSLSSRAYGRAIAFVVSFVALYIGAEVYRIRFPAPPYNVPSPLSADHRSKQ
jgi:hypothetical protein